MSLNEKQDQQEHQQKQHQQQEQEHAQSSVVEDEAAKEKRRMKQNGDCVRAVEAVLGGDRYVRHLIGSMNVRGCQVTRSFFMCEECPEDMLIGGFWDSSRGVVLCQNRPRSTEQIGRTMRHELVHAFDFCRVEFSPSNCLHMACTEIRAANLSGDCNLGMELIRGRGLSFTAHKQECVKRIATTSLMMNPNCAENSQRSVELAWGLCWPDTSPFDHIP